jgi:hypothetical protein
MSNRKISLKISLKSRFFSTKVRILISKCLKIIQIQQAKKQNFQAKKE